MMHISVMTDYRMQNECLACADALKAENMVVGMKRHIL